MSQVEPYFDKNFDLEKNFFSQTPPKPGFHESNYSVFVGDYVKSCYLNSKDNLH